MIRNIWAVGRNYADHAKELGNSVPESPLIFLKAGTCLTNTSTISLPVWATEVHHELELAFQVNEQLQISSWALALDLTERKIQNELKNKGQPWTLAKSFTGSAPISELKSGKNWNQLKDLSLQLKINGQVRQEAILDEMIFKPLDLLNFVKGHFPLTTNDLVLTGTPAGVGPIRSGDILEARLGDWLFQQWTVV